MSLDDDDDDDEVYEEDEHTKSFVPSREKEIFERFSQND